MSPITRQQQAASGGRRRTGGGGSSRASKGEGSIASRRGVRRGRGATFVRARNLSNGWSHRRPGTRRVIVKSRSVRAAGRNGRAAAHLRYIQRDGTARDGERGRLYSGTEDRADGDAFLDRGQDDRHQFRFIVSPEDAGDLADLTGYTRDLMAQVEADLGTKLDWVAVNHHNTGHPHVHDSAGRPSDRAIAGMAEGGIYRPSRHLEEARFEGRVPGGDYDGFVASHVGAIHGYGSRVCEGTAGELLTD